MAEEGKSILIADDSSTMLRILRATLSKCGFTNITEASNGNDAYDKCLQADFDCVLTDWNMPGIDGLELTQKLRKLPKYAKTPIVMVSTEGDKNDVIEALSHGIDSYIVKPFTPAILKEKLDALSL